MKTKTNPAAAGPATLTERELFARFLISKIMSHRNYGSLTNSIPYVPELKLTGDAYLYDWAEEMRRELAESECPDDTLRCIIDELESVARLFGRVREEFSLFMGAHNLGPEEDDGPDRYRMPTVPTTEDDEEADKAAPTGDRSSPSEDASEKLRFFSKSLGIGFDELIASVKEHVRRETEASAERMRRLQADQEALRESFRASVAGTLSAFNIPGSKN